MIGFHAPETCQANSNSSVASRFEEATERQAQKQAANAWHRVKRTPLFLVLGKAFFFKDVC